MAVVAESSSQGGKEALYQIDFQCFSHKQASISSIK